MSITVVVCVIGAGFHGLIAARRFLELYPAAKLMIFEVDSYLGGVWSRERVYEELLTESSLGVYEYSDEPMMCDRISGKQISLYLENYAQKHHLYERTRFNTRVKNFAKSEKSGQWHLELENEDEVVECDKLIIATGLTSTPSMPVIPTGHSFSIPQHHVRSLSKIKIHSPDQHVIVVGGAKSAYDAAFTMTKQGARHVILVIKENGPGPAWLIPECLLFHVDTDKWIVRSMWQLAEELIKWQIGYEKNENLKKLLPQSGSLLWSSTNTCILNHQDFAEMIRQEQIEVKRSTIVELEGTKTVRFADGTELTADLLIWATGWKSNLFPSTSKEKTELEHQAETYVLDPCPVLKQRQTATTSPFVSLYRRLVPLDYIDDHSIVYVGMLQSPGTGVIAEVQAVWGALYLMNEFEIKEEVQWETAMTNVWLKRRYPMVERHSNYTHDFIQYADLLLKDLELNTRRKKSGWWWWREIFDLYMSRNYQGIVAEW